MVGVDRQKRNYKTQEVFTPDWMVKTTLKEASAYIDIDSVCLDRAVGDGQFAAKVLMAKMLHFQKNLNMDIHESFVRALDGIFGVDIERENVEICRERLLCGCTDPDIVALVHRRILIGNCLNPNERIDGQTGQDHQLMKQYFTLNLIDFS
jgi:hypothetical protein